MAEDFDSGGGGWQVNWGALAAMAVAVVVVLALPLGLIALVVSQSRGERDAAPPDSVRVSVFDLRAGNCFHVLDQDGEIAHVRVVDCTEPHPSEVIDVRKLAAGPWPGDDALAEKVGADCEQRLEAYAGDLTDRPDVGIDVFTPTEGTWGYDTTAVCAVTSDQPLTSSLRRSAP